MLKFQLEISGHKLEDKTFNGLKIRYNFVLYYILIFMIMNHSKIERRNNRERLLLSQKFPREQREC